MGSPWDTSGSLKDTLGSLGITLEHFLSLWHHIGVTLGHFGITLEHTGITWASPWGAWEPLWGQIKVALAIRVTLGRLGSLLCDFGYSRVTWESLWSSFTKHSFPKAILMILYILGITLEIL